MIGWKEGHLESASWRPRICALMALRCPNGDLIPFQVCAPCDPPAEILGRFGRQSTARQQSCRGWTPAAWVRLARTRRKCPARPQLFGGPGVLTSVDAMVVDSDLDLPLQVCQGAHTGDGSGPVELIAVAVVVFNHRIVVENQQPAASLNMRSMTPEERQKFLHSSQFRKRFSPEGQNILRGFGRLFHGGAPAP